MRIVTLLVALVVLSGCAPECKHKYGLYHVNGNLFLETETLNECQIQAWRRNPVDEDTGHAVAIFICERMSP